MSKRNDNDLVRTQELFELLQGRLPEGTTVSEASIPHLTPDQAWTVIWYLGNQYWEVTDRVERCGVCGCLYDTWQEGDSLDFGDAPYSFCERCMSSAAYVEKQSQEADYILDLK